MIPLKPGQVKPAYEHDYYWRRRAAERQDWATEMEKQDAKVVHDCLTARELVRSSSGFQEKKLTIE
ncbi:MAG: hypothetical protein F4Z62_07415 [Rhodothermaceae bacterium]|nr:hypothetical protein [Rhodothermaceae bacterium]MYE63677.1 hypothetical protein [Rhodothermaceae bacterium]